MPRLKKEHRIRQDTGMEEKHCGECDTWKPLGEYHKDKKQWDNLKSNCKTCSNARSKKRHRELYATEEGREYQRAHNRRSFKKRKMNGKARAYHKAYYKKRYKEDSAFRTKKIIRHRIYECFKKVGAKKNAKTKEIMGCTPEFLNAHLEKYFVDGMSWENYGKWHIDHVVPCVAFGVSLEEQKILHW